MTLCSTPKLRPLLRAIAAPLPLVDEAPARVSWLDRPLAAFPAWRWETVIWVGLVLLAAVLRLYNLGARGMSHDESLHTMYGYYLFNEGRYEHNPMMHGPFRFHMTALSYFLFGASDFSSRLVPALLGTSLVGLMYAFRRWIGRSGALVAAVLITVSPSLLFHSRYIRDDIFIATFTTLWALGAFRYLETRRYRWLMLMVLAMGFSFVTMENSFITGAVFGAFFVLLALWQAISWRTLVVIGPAIPLGIVAYYFHHNDQDNIAVPLVGAALLVTVALALYFLLRNKGWSRLRSALPADIAILMATLVLPFMAPFAHLALGGEAKVFSSSEYMNDAMITRMALLVGGVTLLAIVLAFLWFRVIRKGDEEGRIGLNQWAQLMAAFWVIQVLFYTTFFTNTRNGLASGIVGSLGYWLAQQNVERGSQPWYYYPFIGALYEFLPIILTLAGAVALVRGFVFKRDWSPVAATDLPANARFVVARGGHYHAQQLRGLRACVGCGHVVGLHGCRRKDALAAHAYGVAHVRLWRLVGGAAHPRHQLAGGVGQPHRVADWPHARCPAAALHPHPHCAGRRPRQ